MVDSFVQIIEITRNAAILLISGQIDASSCERVYREISSIQTAHKPRNIVLDVSLVEYISSAGLSMWARLAQELSTGGGRLSLVGMQEWVRRSIDMLGYTSYFDYWESMYPATEAMAAD
jgi:anti-anti-sigma factor